jgi:hypothetical protein
MPNGYKRHGKTTLFAALNSASGKVISLCQQRHRQKEWIKFLRLIDDAAPPGKELNLIADNYYVDQHNPNPKPFIWTAKAIANLSNVIRIKSAVLDL